MLAISSIPFTPSSSANHAQRYHHNIHALPRANTVTRHLKSSSPPRHRQPRIRVPRAPADRLQARSTIDLPLILCRASSAAAGQSSDGEERPPLQVELPTPEAQQSSLRFCAIRAGGGAAIVVEAVAVGSAAAEAGVRPGLQLLALSDPIRAEECWTLNERVSLRYVKDAVRMRRLDFIKFEFSSAPLVTTPTTEEEEEVSVSVSAQGAVEVVEEEETDLLSAIAVEAAAAAAASSSSNSSSHEDGHLSTRTTTTTTTTTTTETIGERLERNYRKDNAGLTDLERRVAKRKEYFEQSSERNDSLFFAGVFAAFFLPALTILGVAVYTGYLDTLAEGWAAR